MSRRRSNPYDREILRLALPAFGALMAEPLYVLTDTAIVGHLGTAQLAGLGVASAILLTTYTVFIFLAYGTTGAVARLLGAGDDAEAARQGIQGIWLAGALSIVTGAFLYLAAPSLIDLLGAEGAVASNALIYLRISVAGLPALFVTMAGTGYLRGLQDTRTPMVVAIVTSVINLVVQVFLIYGLSYGIGASAFATVVAQTLGAAVYLQRVVRSAGSLGVSLAPDLWSIRRLAVVGRDLMVRTAALRTSLLMATAVATRLGPVDVASHQVAFELWTFLALALDAIAIAGQAITGRLLGASDAEAANAAGRRMIQWGLIAGLLFGALLLPARPFLPQVFSGDPEVVALSGFLLLWVAALQPINGVAFVLDGILIGAGDLHFMAQAMLATLAVFTVAIAIVVTTGLGIGWLWASLGLLMTTRTVMLQRRFNSGAWVVLGAER